MENLLLPAYTPIKDDLKVYPKLLFAPQNTAEISGPSLQGLLLSIPQTLPCFSDSRSSLSHTAGPERWMLQVLKKAHRDLFQALKVLKPLPG
jgi:hypothetical protein